MAPGIIRRRAAARAQQQTAGGPSQPAGTGGEGGEGGGPAGPFTGESIRAGLPERLQILLAILLGATALLTAWAAYRGDLYGGDSLIRFNEAVQLTDQSGQAYNEFNQNLVEDTNTFLQFAIAAQDKSAKGKQTSAYITTLFRDEFAPAVEWWTSDKSGDAATPFVAENPDYRSVALAQSEKLDKQAKKKFNEGKDLDDTGDSYVFWTVVLAAALFLFGIAGVTSARPVFWGASGVGVVLLTASVIGLIGVTSGAPPLVT
jgi:hypothetical protein